MNVGKILGKKGKWAVLTLLLAAGLAACTSQPAAPAAQGYLDTITVTGMGEATGAPDMASISLGVSITKTSISAAMEESNAVMEDITQALLALGLAQEDIQTSNFSIWPEDRFDPNTGELLEQKSYRVENTLNLKVRDLSKLGQVIEAALENGANNMYGLSFTVEETSQLATEARGLAVADARVKAEQLAQELGVTLGEVRIASEVEGGGISVMMEAAPAAIGGGGPPVSQGTVTVSVQVVVTFGMTR